MGLKELKLSVNETNEEYDFEKYEDQVKNCTELFEGVYKYGCPGERSTNSFLKNDHFEQVVIPVLQNGPSILNQYNLNAFEKMRKPLVTRNVSHFKVS